MSDETDRRPEFIKDDPYCIAGLAAPPRPLEIAGATVTRTPDGVEIKVGWVATEKVSLVDAEKLRDWLVYNFPKAPVK